MPEVLNPKMMVEAEFDLDCGHQYRGSVAFRSAALTGTEPVELLCQVEGCGLSWVERRRMTL